jgi:hypothetical protein
MMVSHFLWWVILIVIIFLFTIPIAILEKKRSTLSKALFQVFIVLFLAAPLTFNFFTSQVYIIKGRQEHSRYYLFGSKSYALANGKIEQLHSSLTKNVVINETDSLLTCEETTYSRWSSVAAKGLYEEYKPHTVNSVSHRVDYFPDETVPSSISSFLSFRTWRYYLSLRENYQLNNP